jgi:hypothetical protein
MRELALPMLVTKKAPSNRRLVLYAIKHVAEAEVERVRGLQSQISDKFNDEWNSFAQWAQEAAEGDESLGDLASDTRYELEKIRDVAEQMLIVALYRIVELSTTRILGWRWELDLVKRRSLYKADRLNKALRKELGLRPEDLAGFAAIDELRCLNNAVKHEGQVDRKLVKYGWKLGAELAGCSDAVARLHPSVIAYLSDLAEKVVPR